MRAAAILGLGSSPKDLEPFQKNSRATWTLGLPASCHDTDAVAVFGGDGTVHRHLGLLVKLGLPVLVVPRGSGNDFARALHLANLKDCLCAWRGFEAGGDNVRQIDLGVITPRSEDGSLAARYFCCVAGIGLDTAVASIANRFPRWWRRHGGYVMSLPLALARFAPVHATFSVAGSDLSELSNGVSGKFMLAAFANAISYGGGMRIAPEARLDDGQLDVCVVREMGKVKLASLFPSVYVGKHLGITGVESFRAENVRIDTDPVTDIYADGEYVCRTPADISVQRRALKVIAGAV